jgi:hypothetical protein
MDTQVGTKKEKLSKANPSSRLVELLGDRAEYLLDHVCKTIDKADIHLPSPSHVDEVWINSNRSNQTLRSMQVLLGAGVWLILVMYRSSRWTRA